MRIPMQAFRTWSVFRLALALAAGTSPLACSQESRDVSSQPLVTDVQHSGVKQQSIGNCWLYAAAGWAESLHLSATGETVDLSESYWTWWHFYDQLVGAESVAELSTGGWWGTSNNLIEQHGYLFEHEFIAAEGGLSRSDRQTQALDALNQQLRAGGALATPAQRNATNVRAQLDLAFGTNMAEAEGRAHAATGFVVGAKADGSAMTLQDVTSGREAWSLVNYPVVEGQDAVATPAVIKARKALLQRVMKALNDKQPVVMTVMIDFNAWNRSTGTFELETLRKASGPGQQGGHMVILEDYVVDNVPGIGSIGEGDVSAELKSQALQGDLRYFVAKNSWSAGVSQGYHRFAKDYLDAQLGWTNGGAAADHYTTLSGFVLPAGY